MAKKQSLDEFLHGTGLKTTSTRTILPRAELIDSGQMENDARGRNPGRFPRSDDQGRMEEAEDLLAAPSPRARHLPRTIGMDGLESLAGLVGESGGSKKPSPRRARIRIYQAGTPGAFNMGFA
jgi:hypothetical protein